MSNNNFVGVLALAFVDNVTTHYVYKVTALSFVYRQLSEQVTAYVSLLIFTLSLETR